MDDIFLFYGRILFERIMGFLDRDMYSKTYGCFDRNYWHYKIQDYANIRFQEAAYYLVLLGRIFPDARCGLNRYVEAAIIFWAKNRHKDGSGDEVYPWERSFCATAMSTQAITEAMLMLQNDFNVDLRSTGRWLSKSNRQELTNQMAAACLSLYNIYLITDESSFASEAEKKLDMIIDAQLQNGCYSEFGGADIGYATITLSLLGRYADKSRSERALDSMRRCERYLESKIKDDGTYEYDGMTRRTQFIYPSGLRRMKNQIVERVESGLWQNSIVNPLWMDDRYCIPLATDYLLTYLLSGGKE